MSRPQMHAGGSHHQSHARERHAASQSPSRGVPLGDVLLLGISAPSVTLVYLPERVEVRYAVLCCSRTEEWVVCRRYSEVRAFHQNLNTLLLEKGVRSKSPLSRGFAHMAWDTGLPSLPSPYGPWIRTNRSKRLIEKRRSALETYLQSFLGQDGLYSRCGQVRAEVDAFVAPEENTPPCLHSQANVTAKAPRRVFRVIAKGERGSRINVCLPQAVVSEAQCGRVYDINIDRDAQNRPLPLRTLRLRYLQLLRFHTWLLSSGDTLPSREEAQRFLIDKGRKLTRDREEKKDKKEKKEKKKAPVGQHCIQREGRDLPLESCKCTARLTCLLPHVTNVYHSAVGVSISVTPPGVGGEEEEEAGMGRAELPSVALNSGLRRA